MRHTGFELGAIIASAIAHDASVVADRVDERIQARHRSFVGSVFLAELDRAPAALQADIGVTRAQALLDLRVRGRSGGRRKSDLGFDLEYTAQMRDKPP